MSYIRTHKTTITIETVPEQDPRYEDATVIQVGISDDIDLDENSEEYREALRELAINLTRTAFVSLAERGIFNRDELAGVLAEKVYLPIKNDLLVMSGSSRLTGGATLREIVLDEEEEEDDDQ